MLSVDDGFIREQLCCLQLDNADSEFPLKLLPELQELTFSRIEDGWPV